MTEASASPDPIAAFCDTLACAQRVTAALSGHGFAPSQLSVVGSERDPMPPRSLEERLHEWSGRGSVWGALGGLALGVVLVLPPVGPVIAMGPIATLLLVALEGAMLGGGLSAIAATLTGLGLTEESARRCEDAVVARRFIVFVHGSSEDVARARALVAEMRLGGVHAA